MKTIYFITACICTLFLPGLAHAQTFTSVDIYPGADSSNPSYLMEYNNKLYFNATDGVHGYELWVSDGTPGGTHMVADIWPGSGSSDPSGLIVFNGKLYFGASDSTHGYELWVTDGTAGGTSLVKDIYTGMDNSYPQHLTIYNGKLIFSATDSAHGTELWSSDGTTSGTVLLNDINPGPAYGNPGYYTGFVAMNNKLFFDADDGTHGDELWTTDGTTGGTVMVADINAGANGSYPGYDQGYGPGMVAANNKLYFEAGDSLHGYELWASNGTTGGTALVADIWPGPTGSGPGYYGGFIVNNGKVYFNANDSTHGPELWVTDGTTGGTNLVKDVYPGTEGSYPEFYAVFNNKIYYSAQDTEYNYQVWSSDGTTAGTKAVTNLYEGTQFAFDPWQFTVFNNQLFFIGDDSTVQGFQLYSLNTSDSLSLLQPAIATNTNPLNEHYPLFPFNGSLAFAASYNSIGNELWFYTPAPAAIGHVEALNGISVYPNPFTGNITLTGLQTGQPYQLKLSDIQGRDIDAYEVTGTGATSTLQLPATLASGVYMLQVSHGGAAQTMRLVKH